MLCFLYGAPYWCRDLILVPLLAHERCLEGVPGGVLVPAETAFPGWLGECHISSCWETLVDQYCPLHALMYCCLYLPWLAWAASCLSLLGGNLMGQFCPLHSSICWCLFFRSAQVLNPCGGLPVIKYIYRSAKFSLTFNLPLNYYYHPFPLPSAHCRHGG